MADVSIGSFSIEQTRIIWDVVQKSLAAAGIQNTRKIKLPDEPGAHRVRFKNNSGEEIPAFACMEIEGTEENVDLTFLSVKKPTTVFGQYIFNSQFSVSDDSYGWAYPWNVVRMLGTGLAEANQCFGAIPGSWFIEPQCTGPFIVYGVDNLLENIYQGRINRTGQAIYRFALLGSLSEGTAPATIKDMCGTELATDTVRDPESIFFELSTGDTGLAFLQCGKFYVIQAPCPEGE